MIGLLQRVSEASVVVDGQTVGRIDTGLLVLLGIEKGDAEPQADRLLERLLAYRVFPDGEGRMNLSLMDIRGNLLLVPQFTLVADTRKGNRPGFSSGASPEAGEKLYKYMLSEARKALPGAQGGRFGAHMHVHLVNDGPVTFWLRTVPDR